MEDNFSMDLGRGCFEEEEEEKGVTEAETARWHHRLNGT